MGRHSSPDDDEDVDVGARATAADTSPTLDLAPRRGRHATRDSDEPDAQPTQMIAVVDAELLESADAHAHAETGLLPTIDAPLAEDQHARDEHPVAQPDRKAAKRDRKAAKSESDTRADLRLLREHPAVRAQCVAAVVVAFGLYTLVMVVLGKLGNYAFWVWVPIVAGGVLIGVVLDLAHRRLNRAARADTGTEAAVSKNVR